MPSVHNTHGSVINTMYFKKMNQQRNHYKYPTHLPPSFDKSLENPQTKQKCIFFSHVLLQHKIIYPPPNKYTLPAHAICAQHTWFSNQYNVF